MMYEVSLIERPDHKVWIPAGHFDPAKHVKHSERIVTADDMLDWIDGDWPSIESDATGTTIARLEPGQGANNMFRGRNIREALVKAMTTPPFKGPTPQEFDRMSEDEQLAANPVEGYPPDCTCNGDGKDCVYAEHRVWRGPEEMLPTVSDGWYVAGLRHLENKEVSVLLARNIRGVLN